MRNVNDLKTLMPRFIREDDDPAFSELTAEERRARPELRDVEAMRLFTTKTGVTLVCLITDRKIYTKNRMTPNGDDWGGFA